MCPKDPSTRFQISDWRDLIRHLRSIDASAQLVDGKDDEVLAIAKDLQVLARHLIAYVETRNPKTKHAALDKRESVSLKRKAAMLRLLLSGARNGEVARQFGVSDTAVSQNVQPVLFTLRKRSRLISRMSDRKDPLEPIGSTTVPYRSPPRAQAA